MPVLNVLIVGDVVGKGGRNAVVRLVPELKKKHGYLDFEEIVNRSVVETMGRSLNNSMTIIFMLFVMYLMGGDSTKWFIFALLIGTISGTYSSTFTAAPLVIMWDRFEHKLRKS